MKNALLLYLCFATTSFAQDKLIVADDSSSGTYKAMLGEISEFCSGDSLNIVEFPGKGGAIGNLEALKNNKASAAFLHSDVVFSASQVDPSYRELKTLVALYPEEIHIVALKNSGIQTGGNMVGWGKTAIEFRNLGDLRGHKIAAAGGGCISAKILTGQGEGGFEVVCKDSGKEVLPALDSGEVQAAVFVGGAPLSAIENLSDTKYKLLSIPEAISSKLAGVYHGATLNYTNLKSGPVKTLAPDAILLTRKYTRPAMVAPQAKFRQCFYAHLDDLKETPGKHAKWQQVDSANHGVWEWYELPSVTAPTSNVATTKGSKK